ncbi:MAG: MarR family transcriptional regulator [Chloroflexi bacterium]|nr:MarR family transcriptional regulator [Chloroflexota bacterium]
MTADRLVEDLLSLWRVLRRASLPVGADVLTAEQFWLLRHLRDHGPTSVGGLARVLEVTSSTVTTTCKRLERRGLLARQRSGCDERVVEVRLTEQGVRRVDTGRQRRRAVLADLLSVLEADERKDLQRLVERVLGAVGEQTSGEHLVEPHR